jgi:hypothetical protein
LIAGEHVSLSRAALRWFSPIKLGITSVLDSACAFTKNLEKPISRECALTCAKQGSQLVILTKDGTIYWPIDSATPAKGQNARLAEFAGNRVTATGKLYDRGGSHALVIEQIAAAK